MKKKNNNLLLLIIILVSLFIVFLFIRYRKYNYTDVYYINDIKVTEKYNKDSNNYLFLIDYKNTIIPYVIDSTYLDERKLINDIVIDEKDGITCILPKSNNLLLYPECLKDNEVYSYNNYLNTDFYKYKNITLDNKEYGKIKVNFLNDKSYLLYNYRGFYLIDNNTEKNIQLFNKDIYILEDYYELDNYLIIPDYNSNYFFQKLFIINKTNGNVKEIKCDDISFDLMFLGNIDNLVYFIDKKNEIEYEININKNKITETEFQIVENNKLVKKSYKEIINSNINEVNNNWDFKLEDNNLYLSLDKININITSDVTKIIKIDKDTVYYLKKDKLYMFNNYYGEVLLISFFEWNFNNTNVIFISK